jgi:hypothetical protein
VVTGPQARDGGGPFVTAAFGMGVVEAADRAGEFGGLLKSEPCGGRGVEEA